MKKSSSLNRFKRASLSRYENSKMRDDVELVSVRCPVCKAEDIRKYARVNRVRVPEAIGEAITNFLKGRTK